MARNIICTMTQGEVGKELWMLFEPTDRFGVPRKPDTTEWALTLTVKKGSQVFLDEVTMFPAPDQEGPEVSDEDAVNRGWCYYVFDEDSAQIAPGQWNVRGTGIDELGVITKYPTLINREYAILKVNRP